MSTQYKYSFFLFWTQLLIGENSIKKRTCSLHIHVHVVLIIWAKFPNIKWSIFAIFQIPLYKTLKKIKSDKNKFLKIAKLIISCLGIHEYPSHPAILLKYVCTRQNIKMEEIYWQKIQRITFLSLLFYICSSEVKF